MLSAALGRKPEMRLTPLQPVDVKATYADTDDLRRELDRSATTPIDVGLTPLVPWCRDQYGGAGCCG